MRTAITCCRRTSSRASSSTSRTKPASDARVRRRRSRYSFGVRTARDVVRVERAAPAGAALLACALCASLACVPDLPLLRELPPRCGDGVVDGDEECAGEELAGPFC